MSVSAALGPGSTLLRSVWTGKQALERSHARRVREDTRTAVDSLDLDEALRETHPRARRWDDLVGVRGVTELVAIEVHTAIDKNAREVVEKKRAAQEQLREHLRPGAHVGRWIWLASGSNGFTRTGRAARMLAQSAIEFCPREVDL